MIALRKISLPFYQPTRWFQDIPYNDESLGSLHKGLLTTRCHDADESSAGENNPAVTVSELDRSGQM